jgi:hypothetical protein
VSVNARLVRTFTAPTPAGGAVEQQVARELELPMPSARGQLVRLPGYVEPLAIVRVVVTPVAANAWNPGFLPPRVTVELEPEPAEGLAAAFESGWKSA